ncbi:MAG: GNAT family N-acetyltransferase [Actinobacteria bacterium]|nr:GNAT family N-acetyltransferase [Actinomycetota bacterium]MBE3114744.1 GNAT family N-acetyltransferase [Actinomycetota bacterium]
MSKGYTIGLTRYNLTLQAVDDLRTPLAYLSIYIDKKGRKITGHLMGYIRHGEYKGLGITRDIVEQAIELCKSLGCQQIVSGILKSREGLISLFQELGFEEIRTDSKEHRKFRMKI